MSGIRATPLGSYLAGLGLIRVLAEQADPALTACWANDRLVIDTTVEDVAGWLAERYTPTPVLSPWNEGSGFGTKDKKPKQVLARLLANPDPRLDGYRAAADVAQRVGTDYRDGALTKTQAIRTFRNQCPEALLPWIDATVVLTDADAAFPPLLGSGGNDGRLDFSTNFHQRLLDVLEAGPRARGWAEDLLTGRQTERLVAAAVGQFDPVGAGGKRSSPFGEAESLVNPWKFVLMIEGALLFAAGVSRRNLHGSGRAAIPFTVTATAAATAGGASGEATRGEVWTPLWHRPYTMAEVRQLFGEARAFWAGRPAVRSVDFYQAVASHGVARGVAAFERYGLHQRNGLAFVAVPLDRVDVHERPAVGLAAQLESWVIRLPRTAPAAVASAVRAFEASQIQFARQGDSAALLRLLAALTDVELAVARAGRLRGEVPARRPPAADAFLAALAEAAELRVAVGLASCATGNPDRRTMRDLLMNPETIPGYHARPLRDVLSDVLVWRLRNANAGDGAVTTFPAGIRVPAADLHAWAGGRLDERAIEQHLHALIALDWQHTRHRWHGQPAPVVPVPTLALLQVLADGYQPRPTDPPIGLDPGWAVRLRAEQTSRVHTEAARQLRRVGLHTAPPGPPIHSGRALAAALIPRCLGAKRLLHLHEED